MIDRFNSMVAGLALYVPAGARRRLRLADVRGQAFVEYVLLLTVVAIAVALIAEWGNFVGAITNALQTIETKIQNPTA